MLAKKDFKRVLEYDLNSHGLAEGLSGDIILPDLLRMKGQALIALDRIDEAREALVKAQEIAEVCGSRFTLWRVLDESSRVTAIEGRQEDENQLLFQSMPGPHRLHSQSLRQARSAGEISEPPGGAQCACQRLTGWRLRMTGREYKPNRDPV